MIDCARLIINGQARGTCHAAVVRKIAVDHAMHRCGMKLVASYIAARNKRAVALTIADLLPHSLY